MEISFAILPALIHLYIFALESLMWGRKRTNKVFALKPEEASSAKLKLFAFNQGFYNLFLALAVFLGLCLRTGEVTQQAGSTLILYGLISMIGAGVVLILSARNLWRAGLIQIIPALIGIVPYLK